MFFILVIRRDEKHPGTQDIKDTMLRTYIFLNYGTLNEEKNRRIDELKAKVCRYNSLLAYSMIGIVLPLLFIPIHKKTLKKFQDEAKEIENML